MTRQVHQRAWQFRKVTTTEVITLGDASFAEYEAALSRRIGVVGS